MTPSAPLAERPERAALKGSWSPRPDDTVTAADSLTVAATKARITVRLTTKA